MKTIEAVSYSVDGIIIEVYNHIIAEKEFNYLPIENMGNVCRIPIDCDTQFKTAYCNHSNNTIVIIVERLGMQERIEMSCHDISYWAEW